MIHVNIQETFLSSFPSMHHQEKLEHHVYELTCYRVILFFYSLLNSLSFSVWNSRSTQSLHLGGQVFLALQKSWSLRIAIFETCLINTFHMNLIIYIYIYIHYTNLMKLLLCDKFIDRFWWFLEYLIEKIFATIILKFAKLTKSLYLVFIHSFIQIWTLHGFFYGIKKISVECKNKI